MLGRDLVPGVDLIEHPDPSGRDTDLIQFGEQFIDTKTRERRLDGYDQLLPMGGALSIGTKSRIPGIETEPISENMPEPLTTHTDLDGPAPTVAEAVPEIGR